MKKLIMLFVAALAVSSVATAQVRVDVAGNTRKVEASDADIQNSKKNTKAATWMNRGNVYYQAAIAPTAGIYKGLGETEANLLIGKPAETKVEEVNGQRYTVWVYDAYDLYLPEGSGQVVFWKQKINIVNNGLETAYEAYKKAAELDSRQVAKVKPLILKVADAYKQEADVTFSAGDYKAASSAFAKAYEISTDPLVNEPDSMSAYNAGYVAILGEDFDQAIKYLTVAKNLGYDQDGELYFLFYHAYNGKKDVANAEAILKEGIQKYPGNSKLIESMILHYTTTGQDASQMIPMVQEALAKDPDNFVFHFGLGMIYDKLGDFNNAAAEFKKSMDLNPEDFSSAFNLAITYVRHGEEMAKELNDIPLNEQARYDAKLGEINDLYKKALPYFQKAHELNPEDSSSVELMKNIYFRFRDDSPEMMQNYEKYNELLKTL